MTNPSKRSKEKAFFAFFGSGLQWEKNLSCQIRA